MSDIPSEVYREILLRLPADSLFRFRCVCKAWRGLIDDSSFVKSHTNNQLSSNTLLIRNSTGAPLYLVNLDSLEFVDDDRQMLDAIPVKQLIRPGVPRLRDLPATSCNGLILISSDDIKKIWAVWNPLTRECRQLPQTDAGLGFLSLVGTGLGYDYAADDYRVVRIDHCCLDRVIEYRTLVYSMKSASWRRIKDCPFDFWCDPAGVFLNGALHWRRRDMIIVLDLGTEDYRHLPLPPAIPIERGFLFDVRLDAVGGYLTLSYSDYGMDRFYGWVMRDYGSWIRLLMLDLRIGDFLGKPRRLVAYLESKRQVLLQKDKGFLWIDVENNSVKQVTVHGLTRISSSQICPGSLYQLNDGGNIATAAQGLKKGKRKRTRKLANTRLKFCVRDCDTWCCSDYSCCSSPSCSSYEGEE